MKIVVKSIKLLLIVAALFLCEQVGLAKVETRITNNNLNKTLDLKAMAVKIEEFRINDLQTPIDT